MLITDLGYFALISALVIAILQVILPAVGVQTPTCLATTGGKFCHCSVFGNRYVVFVPDVWVLCQ